MPSAVTINWTPDPIVFGEAILEVEEGLRHTEIPMALAAQEVKADIRERFNTQTDPDGTPWDDWAPSYENYAIEFPNYGILDQTGELRERAENAVIVTGDTLFFDEGRIPERGIWHQEGRMGRMTKQGTPNPLPPRRFLGLTPESSVFIMAGFVDWFDNVIDLFTTATGRVGRRHARRGPLGTFVPRSSPMPMRIR